MQRTSGSRQCLDERLLDRIFRMHPIDRTTALGSVAAAIMSSTPGLAQATQEVPLPVRVEALARPTVELADSLFDALDARSALNLSMDPQGDFLLDPDPGLRSYPGRAGPRVDIRPAAARRLRRLSRPPPVCPNTFGHAAARFRPFRHPLVPLPHLSTVRDSARAALGPNPQPHDPQPMPHAVPARLSPHLGR